MLGCRSAGGCQAKQSYGDCIVKRPPHSSGFGCYNDPYCELVYVGDEPNNGFPVYRRFQSAGSQPCGGLQTEGECRGYTDGVETNHDDSGPCEWISPEPFECIAAVCDSNPPFQQFCGYIDGCEWGVPTE